MISKKAIDRTERRFENAEAKTDREMLFDAQAGSFIQAEGYTAALNGLELDRNADKHREMTEKRRQGGFFERIWH